jgi:MFS family permease
LTDTLGIQSTFYVVGSSYLALAMINRTTLKETQIQRLEQRLSHLIPPLSKTNIKPNPTDGLYEAMRNSIGQWSPLLADTKVRNVVLMNGVYWIALAGSQMTILPLILTDTSHAFALTATQIGKVYMGMSLVQVLGNPIMGPWIDKIGKVPAMVLGCTLLSSTMFALPFCTDLTQLATTLGLWALGSTMLSTAPVSYLADKVPESQRAQAVALLRTAGDIGLLAGASTSGAVADWYNMDIALHSSAGLLLTTTFWFATRYYLSSKSFIK